MKALILFLSICTIVTTGYLVTNQTSSFHVFAATATESASPSAEISPSESQTIVEKFKNIVKENLTATETDLQEKINQQTLVGYVGTIKSINSDSLSIISGDENLIQITTTENSDYLKGGKSIKFSSLAISDKLIVIGTMLKDDIILAKRLVVVSEEEDEMTSGTIVGKIIEINTAKKTVSLETDGEVTIYSLTKKAIANDTVDLTELEEGQNIFAITKLYQGSNYLSVAKVI